MVPFLKNKLFASIFLFAGAALVFSCLAYFGIFSLWQLQLADQLYGSQKASDQIVVVGIDDRTLSNQEGLGNYESWSRSFYAQLLRNINKYQPKVVAFDVVFQSKKDQKGDEDFQQALAETKNPILSLYLQPDVDNHLIQKKNTAVTRRPYELFTQPDNVTLNNIVTFLDKDNVARRSIPIIYDEERNQYYENLALGIVRRFLGGQQAPSQPEISDNKYIDKIGEKIIKIPLEKGEMLINYAPLRLQDGGYISFIDTYKENYRNVDPEKLFKNKIVLIGPMSASFKDSFTTPVNKLVQMPGVEIHANAVQTILDQAFLRNLTLPEQVMLILLFCALGAFVFMYTKIRWSVLFLVALPALYGFAAPFAFSKGLILDLVHPFLAIIAMFMAVYIYRYLTEFKEKIELKGAFAKYVNPKLVDQIMAHPENLKLGGEKRPITVLFTDIAHFTTISESLKPESLVALLNEYFEAMSQVILAEGGTLDKFEGDAIMAFFGAPLIQPDHALRACTAALKMRQKLAELLQKWQTDPPLPGGEKKPLIDFRCGLSSGEVIVGNMGSTTRFDYTVMGDVVNLGSRLEGANKKYDTRIMVSEATAEIVKNQFEMRELDVIKVVGKTQPIKVFEVLNLKGQLVPEAQKLLELYNQGMQMYHDRKFAEALEHFNKILEAYPTDGPSKLYRQRCEVLRDFPPPADWDGVFEMGTK